MDRDKAAEEFAKMLFEVGIKESNKLTCEYIDNPMGAKKSTWEKAKSWYESETEEGKALIQFLIRRATITSVFHIAAQLDGVAGLEYVGERPAEFTVGLRIYTNLDQVDSRIPEETIPICPTEKGYDIHDLVMYLVDEDEA